MHYEFEEGEKERERERKREREREFYKETFVIFTKIHRLIFSRYDIF